uniref:Protein kinase domain-containing protein n=1 Tax=viral metagenome TaxID=1070528 RepID=A0A6C0EQJ6_9ZZZZ
MVKRTKHNPNGELKSSQVPLSIHKYDLSLLKGSALTHWNILNIQPYFPPIEKLFKSSDLECVSDYGIKFNEEAVTILSPDKIRTVNGLTVDVHRKTTMLVSPYKWMRGEYGATLGLPGSIEQATNAMHKIQNTNNAAYVGALISGVLSQSGCVHFPKVYGLFTGTTTKHTIDISDDYGELSERPWFSQNIGRMFDVKLSDEIQESTEFKHTRTARLSIQLGENVDLGMVEELETSHVEDVQMGELNRVLHDEEENDDDQSDSSSVSTSYVFEVRSCTCDEEEDDEDYESCESFAWATFKDVPVQVTLMEKCQGTLYELMMLNPETEKHLAWISQVIFALAYAQRTIGLTHNDLHANNVMYVPTTVEHYYYNCGGVLYRVPTYGYTIKIIDFERGIASVKIAGMKEPKLFMSDHFYIEEEAGGQYNYGDYYVSKYPEMKPNPSFDLARLATSLFWDIFPEPEADNDLYKFFVKWLTVEDGNSVMFGKKDPHHDRFHGFHLYKAIARYCKDNAVPRKEIASLKTIYGVESANGNSVLMIDG